MQDGKTPTIVNLSGSLTIDRAVALKEELSAAFAASDNVLLNISLVDDIDLSCLQVLYAAKSKSAGKSLHFVGSIPARVVKRLASCGFLRGAPDRAEEFEAALIGF
jgi:anti-anti-sigma regulatory factor